MSTLVASAHPSVAGARAARLRESGRLGGALPGGGDPKKGWGNGDASGAQKFTFVLLMHRSLIRNTSSVGDHGRSPLLPMLRDGRSQQIAFAPDAPHQEITADRLCSRCSRISVLMEMREQICSRSILLCIGVLRLKLPPPRPCAGLAAAVLTRVRSYIYVGYKPLQNICYTFKQLTLT